jgi:hypothetical protein
MLNGVESLKESCYGKQLWMNIIAVILGIMMLVPMVAVAEEQNPGVYPVDSTIYGKTYGEWSEEWWKWALSIPASSNPLLDKTGKFCAEGQSGDVWFLAGTWGETGVKRKCEVPAGKGIFFPIINAECSRIEGNGETEEEFRSCARSLIDNVTVKEVKVDGKPLKNLDNYRVGSGLFSFKLPKNNLLRLHPGSSLAVSDGYWIMMEPLSPGKHKIYIYGKAVFQDGSTFETEVTYDLSVVNMKP